MGLIITAIHDEGGKSAGVYVDELRSAAIVRIAFETPRNWAVARFDQASARNGQVELCVVSCVSSATAEFLASAPEAGRQAWMLGDPKHANLSTAYSFSRLLGGVLGGSRLLL